jgi:hypothetical protein
MSDAIRLVVEIDIDGYVRAGITDFQGQPHLFISECLDWDDEKRSRRLGETLFLVPIPADAAETCVREYTESDPPDGDPKWKEKQAERWARWVAVKQAWLQAVEWAWRARGNFRAMESSRKRSVSFRWTLLSKRRVSGDDMRSRLAHLEELGRERSGEEPGMGGGEELPF